MSANQKRSRKRKNTRTKAGRSVPNSPPVLPREAVDTDPAVAEGGTNGHPNADDGPAPQGIDRPGATQPIDRIRAGTAHTQQAEQQPFVRPYRYRTVTDAQDALAFSEWFQSQGGVAVGVAVEEDIIGVASEEEGWHIQYAKNEIVDDTVNRAFQLLLKEDAPFLVCGRSSVTIVNLAQMLDVDESNFKKILHQVKGDLHILQESTGRVIQKGTFPSPADEAYTALTAELHWGNSAPPYYKQVALPWLLQEIWATARKWEGTPFRVSYNDLFLRVLAHFTGEPVMVSAFIDERDPLVAVAEALGLDVVVTGEDQIISILFWAATGFDALYLSTDHPTIYAHLPEGLDELKQVVERHLATITLWAIQQREEYTAKRRLQTLYGRWLMWGLPINDALAQRLLGSVQDILDVAAVAVASFWGEDPLLVYPVTEGLLDRTIRVRGLAPDNERSKWMSLITGAATLGSPPPLDVPLNPAVIWGE